MNLAVEGWRQMISMMSSPPKLPVSPKNVFVPAS